MKLLFMMLWEVGRDAGSLIGSALVHVTTLNELSTSSAKARHSICLLRHYIGVGQVKHKAERDCLVVVVV